MILLLIPALLIGILTYYLAIWSYWWRRGVPGPLGFPVLGVLKNSLENEFPLPLQVKEWTKKYGPVYGITEGTMKTLIISDPTLVHEVFVKQYDNFYGRKRNPIQGDSDKEKRTNLFSSQGFRWKRLRTISSPTFSNNSLRKIKDTVEDCAMELMGHIEEQTAGGEQIDLLRFYQEYTLDVIGRIAMGQTESQMFKNPLLPKIQKIFQGNYSILFLIGGVLPRFFITFLRFVLLKTLRLGSFSKIMDSAREGVKKRIRERENDKKEGVEPGEPQDFIDLFLDAKAEDVEYFGEENDDFKRASSYNNRQLTADEIIGNLFIFLIAGFDTTALSLSYSTYLLSRNPGVMRKVQEEVGRECTEPSISFDQLSKLKYMDCVIKETLRLYPLATIANARQCMRATRIGDMEVEVGTMIQADTWTLHTDKRIWGEDAVEFRPERWQEGSEEQWMHKGGYIPFGLGPRQCIGMRLAYMEEKMLLAHLLRNYNFATGPKTQIPIKLVGRATTQPESVWMHLERR